MKAYLIKPMERSVKEVDYGGDFNEIYKLIDAETFDVVRLNRHRDAVFVDEEGLLKEQPSNNWFVLAGYPQPLAGNGLVIGCDEQGEDRDAKITLDELRAMVTFPILIKGSQPIPRMEFIEIRGGKG